MASQLQYTNTQDSVDCSRYSLDFLKSQTLRPEGYLNLDDNASSTMAAMLNNYISNAYRASSYRFKYSSFPADAFERFEGVDKLFSTLDSDGEMSVDDRVAIKEAYSSALPRTYIVVAKDESGGYVTKQDFRKIVSEMRNDLGVIFQDQSMLTGTADKISEVITEIAGGTPGDLSVNINIGEPSLLSYGDSYALTYTQMDIDFNSSSKDIADSQHNLQLLLHFDNTIYAIYTYSPIEDRDGFLEVSEWIDQLVSCINTKRSAD